MGWRCWRWAATVGGCCFPSRILTSCFYLRTKKPKWSFGRLFPNLRARCGIWDFGSAALAGRSTSASASKRTMQSFIWRCWTADLFPGIENKSAVQQRQMRSEEHTSELQSHLNLVCRLLLEKKKKTFIYSNTSTY